MIKLYNIFNIKWCLLINISFVCSDQRLTPSFDPKVITQSDTAWHFRGNSFCSASACSGLCHADLNFGVSCRVDRVGRGQNSHMHNWIWLWFNQTKNCEWRSYSPKFGKCFHLEFEILWNTWVRSGKTDENKTGQEYTSICARRYINYTQVRPVNFAKKKQFG